MPNDGLVTTGPGKAVEAAHRVWMPEGRGTGTGAERRHADASRAVKQFMRRTLPNTGSVELHVIGPVRQAAAIARLVGFDVTGFDAVVENGTARHTLRNHGFPAAEAKRGQVAVTQEDLARVPWLLFEFDAAEPADPTKQGAPQVRLRKRIGIVDYDVFAEVRKTARQLAFKTMIKRQVRRESS